MWRDEEERGGERLCVRSRERGREREGEGEGERGREGGREREREREAGRQTFPADVIMAVSLPCILTKTKKRPP